MSARSRGEKPKAVALRSETVQKSASVSSSRSFSTRTLLIAYGVTGARSASSATSPSPAAP